ncbi:hypothetical protein RBA69_23460 [Brenneria goodwinii]|uniref:hypothetical protein n=1 Tax=Brenneria goodwinii TaxID=1109412 RepID=UPI0036E8A023
MQIDMQLHAAQCLRLETYFLLIEIDVGIFAGAVLQIVAESRITSGVVHMTWIVDAQALMQRISIRILKRRDGEMSTGFFLSLRAARIAPTMPVVSFGCRPPLITTERQIILVTVSLFLIGFYN